MPTYSSYEKRALAVLLARVTNLESQSANNAAAASNVIKFYNSLALLKAETNPTQIDLFILLGLASAGDGLGGGTYFYSATNAETPNDVTIIQLTSPTTGRVLKIA